MGNYGRVLLSSTLSIIHDDLVVLLGLKSAVVAPSIVFKEGK
jgi:hypothetical protein